MYLDIMCLDRLEMFRVCCMFQSLLNDLFRWCFVRSSMLPNVLRSFFFFFFVLITSKNNAKKKKTKKKPKIDICCDSTSV